MKPKIFLEENRVRGKTPTKCVACDKEFTDFLSSIKSGKAKYCTRKCGYNALIRYGGKKKCTVCKALFEKNNNNFYKNRSTGDGLSTECISCLKNLSRKRTDIRKEFILSKGGCCNKCGITNDILSFFEVDHIIPDYYFRQERKYRKPFTLNDAHNLQVLCPNCHKLKTLEDNKKIKEHKNENTSF